jgi:hypothetical protein
MKFGFFFQLPCAPWQSERERYGDTLAQIERGLMPHQTVLASMRRFAAHIMPNFR